MQLTMRRSTLANAVPTLVVLALLVALALGLLLAGVGRPDPSLPLPDGLAANGRMVYVAGGNLVSANDDGVDVRPLMDGSGERAAVETRELAADDWVVIPAGVAHGFLALEPLELLYLVTNEFDNSDELGFAWDDPAVGVPWPRIEATPDGRPILSDRDQSNPSLAELVASLRG